MAVSGRKSATPWRDWPEWQRVHAALFSGDAFERQRAISRVAAWRSRAQLPVAIDATAQLAELQLHEQLAEHHHHAVGVSSRSHMELTLLYASVVVRCVNGLVDGSQNGTYAMSVSSLAQRIGIPLWIVDLRHESTHNQLPSLPVLRFAAQHLLAWLRANYWQKQEEAIRVQVHQAAAWLYSRPPFASASEVTTTDNSDLLLDADNLRNLVVPLLVFGEQYGERVASTGLLFAGPPGDDRELDETCIQAHIGKFTGFLLDLQARSEHLSAWLLGCIADKLFAEIARQPGDDQEQGTDNGELPEQSKSVEWELKLAFAWIQFLTSKGWRDQLKFAPGATEDIYCSGAEVLVAAERLRLLRCNESAPKTPRGTILDQLLATLRASNDINTHRLVKIEPAVSESAGSNMGWSSLPGWVSCPVGHRWSYNSAWLGDSGLEEYALEEDSLTSECKAFALASECETSDTQIDQLLEEFDNEYDSNVQRIVQMQSKIGQNLPRNGSKVTAIPQQELERIQDEIEIW